MSSANGSPRGLPCSRPFSVRCFSPALCLNQHQAKAWLSSPTLRSAWRPRKWHGMIQACVFSCSHLIQAFWMTLVWDWINPPSPAVRAQKSFKKMMNRFQNELLCLTSGDRSSAKMKCQISIDSTFMMHSHSESPRASLLCLTYIKRSAVCLTKYSMYHDQFIYTCNLKAAYYEHISAPCIFFSTKYSPSLGNTNIEDNKLPEISRVPRVWEVVIKSGQLVA